MKKWLMLLNFCPALAIADPSSLGRLFFTPAERAQLEQDSAPPPVSTPSRLPALEINGIVQRSDGKGTVWINRYPRQEDTIQENVRIDKLRPYSDQVRLTLPQRRLSLLPGQHLDPVTGKASENIVVQQSRATR
jgi:hypothetical protein